MSIPNTIAGQLHHTKPDSLTPGRDVGMKVMADNVSVGILIRPLNRMAVVIYNEGSDDYSVAVGNAPYRVTLDTVEREFDRLHHAADSGDEHGGYQVYSRVYADQIGEFVWGDDAKEWTLPMVAEQQA